MFLSLSSRFVAFHTIDIVQIRAGAKEWVCFLKYICGVEKRG